jgi:hypothetical protein
MVGGDSGGGVDCLGESLETKRERKEPREDTTRALNMLLVMLNGFVFQ